MVPVKTRFAAVQTRQKQKVVSNGETLRRFHTISTRLCVAEKTDYHAGYLLLNGKLVYDEIMNELFADFPVILC